MSLERIALIVVASAGVAFGLIESGHSQIQGGSPPPTAHVTATNGDQAWIFDGKKLYACRWTPQMQKPSCQSPEGYP